MSHAVTSIASSNPELELLHISLEIDQITSPEDRKISSLAQRILRIRSLGIGDLNDNILHVENKLDRLRRGASVQPNPAVASAVAPFIPELELLHISLAIDKIASPQDIKITFLARKILRLKSLGNPDLTDNISHLEHKLDRLKRGVSVQSNPTVTASAVASSQQIEASSPAIEPYMARSSHSHLSDVAKLLRTNNESQALTCFKENKDEKLKNKSFYFLWVVKGRPSPSSPSEELRKMADDDFGKVSFMNQKPRCASKPFEKALAVELATLSPLLLLQSLTREIELFNSEKSKELFSLLSPKLQTALAQKMRQAMGENPFHSLDFARECLLNNQTTTQACAIKNQALLSIKEEIKTLQTNLESKLEKLQERFTNGHLSDVDKKTYLHELAKWLIENLEEKPFELEPISDNIDIAIGNYIRKYPSIAHYLLIFSAHANENYKREPFLQLPANQASASSSAINPYLVNNTHRVLADVARFLRVNNECRALIYFDDLDDASLKNKSFYYLWVVKGRPSPSSPSEELRKMADADFGKVSFMNQKPHCTSKRFEKALAVELALFSPMLLLQSLTHEIDRLNTEKSKELFSLLPPKIQRVLAQKMLQAIGANPFHSLDFARECLLNNQATTEARAIKNQVLLAIKDEIQSLQSNLEKKIENLQEHFTSSQFSDLEKKTNLHELAKWLIENLEEKIFEAEQVSDNIDTAVGNYIRKYPSIAPYLLIFSARANENYRRS